MEKKFTKRFTAFVIACALAPLTTVAQSFNESVEQQKGYEASLEGGVMSKVMFLQNKRSKSWGDMQNRMMSRFGIRDLKDGFQTKSTQTTEYDFYGGVSERGNNVPLASVTDAQGNTYITGGSSNLEQQSGDVFTVKISPAGTVLWEAREEAAVFAVDNGMAIILTPDGNIVVSGTYWNGEETDMHTVKYNASDGTQIWYHMYSGTGSGLDVPIDITADTAGNIIVAGITWSGNSVDYLTVKYGSDGTLLWDETENPAGADAWNEPAGVTIDAEGNVIVTGYSPNEEGWLNYYTVKYDANGVEQWAESYHFERNEDEENPESPMIPTNSTPSDVLTDAEGNIYVTGTFDTFSDRFGTIKYSAGGAEEWVKIYRSGEELTNAYALAITDETLYVAGRHYGGFESDGLVLASYAATDGTLNWVEESDDFIELTNIKLMLDGANPVIAAYGGQEGELSPVNNDSGVRAKKYNPEGILLEESQHIIEYTGTAAILGLTGISLAADGDIRFAMSSFYSELGSAFEAAKISFEGTASAVDWDIKNTNTGGFNATMFNAVPDSQGNTYVTGAYYIFNAGLVQLDTHYFILKYTATGEIEWQKIYNAENGNEAHGIIVTTDGEDNVIITLLPHQEQQQGILKIKKYTTEGNLLWEDDKAVHNGRFVTVETGDDGAVYIGGTAKEAEDDFFAKFAAIKYGANGDEDWTLFFDNGDEETNYYEINDGMVTAEGNFLLTGASGQDSMLFDSLHLTVIKVTSEGTVEWTAVAPVENFYGRGYNILVQNDGSIYTAGWAVRNSGNFDDDLLAAKVSADGVLEWTRTVGVGDRHDRAFKIEAFSTGEIAVAGYSQAMQGSSIYNMLIKYDTEGNEVWTYESESRRFFNDFHLDGSDTCFILNQAQLSTMPYRLQNGPFPVASLIVVSADGTAEEEFFVGPAYSESYASVLVPHQDNRLLLAGSLANQVFYEGIYFFESEHDGTLDTGGEHEIPKDNSNWLGQNYPNPASGQTKIPFHLVNGGNVSIKLYNSQGRLVKEIINQSYSAGDNTADFDTSGLAKGIYFYQLTSGKFKQARKLVVN